MWLINTKTLELKYFVGSKIPKYAILSHTWEDEGECSFQEFCQQPIEQSTLSKNGYKKITQTCKMARQYDLDYAWVDTCCIDKSSSAELTESINSMYSWYKNAELCFAYLFDLPAGEREEQLAACRWFTRGWTLQELIAPSNVRFYDQGWTFIGNKIDLSKDISSITGIPESVLRGYCSMNENSLAQRMFWAARRQTTRVEDMSYCLFGIFDVNMPLIYGEGAKAFHRLQEAIIARSDDMTIFAWDHQQEKKDQQWSLFSPSPSEFANCSQIVPFSRRYLSPEYSITNKGLKLHHVNQVHKMRIWNEINGSLKTTYALHIGIYMVSRSTELAVRLRKIGPNIFRREGRTILNYRDMTTNIYQFKSERLHRLNEFHILLHQQDYETQIGFFDIKLVEHDQVQIQEVVPYTLWDEPNRILLLRSAHSQGHDLLAAISCNVVLEEIILQVVICIWDKKTDYQISISPSNNETYEWVERHIRPGHQSTWDGFDNGMPAIMSDRSRDTMELKGANEKTFTISIRMEGGLFKKQPSEITQVVCDVKERKKEKEREDLDED